MEAGGVVDSLRNSQSRLENLSLFAKLLGKILRHGLWRRRYDFVANSVIEFKTFRAFVEAKYPKGCGWTIEEVKTILQKIGDCREVEVLLDEALQNEPGGANNPKGLGGKSGKKEEIVNVDNVNVDNRPTGNSRQRALRKLRQASEDNPEVEAVYKQVLEEKLSPHKAMVRLGFRKPAKSYNGTPLERARKAFRDLSEEDKAAFLKELSS